MLGVIILLTAIMAGADASITSENIGDFNIGQLFTFYDMGGLCKSPVQFAMAKKNQSQQCQWKIGEDLTPKDISNETDLPIVDFNKNCVFSCDYKEEKPGFVAEDLINKYFDEKDSQPRSGYDVYTYLAPCDVTIRGDHTEEATEFFKKYAGVYFTSNPDSCKTEANEINNADILKNGHVTGLFAAQKSSEVSLDDVKKAVNEINDYKMKVFDLESKNKWLFNAVDAFFSQHPTMWKNKDV